MIDEFSGSADPLAGIAPPPFGAPVVSPERKALVGQMIEVGKALLDVLQAAAEAQDEAAVKLLQPIAAAVTKAAGQLQRAPMKPMGADGEAEPELDRTPLGPPSTGEPPMPFMQRAMRG